MLLAWNTHELFWNPEKQVIWIKIAPRIKENKPTVKMVTERLTQRKMRSACVTW